MIAVGSLLQRLEETEMPCFVTHKMSRCSGCRHVHGLCRIMWAPPRQRNWACRVSEGAAQGATDRLIQPWTEHRNMCVKNRRLVTTNPPSTPRNSDCLKVRARPVEVAKLPSGRMSTPIFPKQPQYGCDAAASLPCSFPVAFFCFIS